MPHHRRLFRFRVLLSLSLVYGCSAPGLKAPAPASVSPSASPSPSAHQGQATPISTAPAPASPVPAPSAATPSAQASPEQELGLLSTQEIDKLKNSGLVEANNTFGWQLFNRIYQAEPEVNHFISPLSASGRTSSLA